MHAGWDKFWQHADKSAGEGATGDTRDLTNRDCIYVDHNPDTVVQTSPERVLGPPRATVPMHVLRGRWQVPKHYCRHGFSDQQPYTYPHNEHHTHTDGYVDAETQQTIPGPLSEADVAVYYPSPPQECCNPDKVHQCCSGFQAQWEAANPNDPCVRNGADVCTCKTVSNPLGNGDCGTKPNPDTSGTGPCLTSTEYLHFQMCGSEPPPYYAMWTGTCHNGEPLTWVTSYTLPAASTVPSPGTLTLTYDQTIAGSGYFTATAQNSAGATIDVAHGHYPFQRNNLLYTREKRYDDFWFDMTETENPNQYQTCYNLDYNKVASFGMMCEDFVGQCKCGGGLNSKVCLTQSEDCDKAWNLYNVESLELHPLYQDANWSDQTVRPNNPNGYQRPWEEYVMNSNGILELTQLAAEKAAPV